MKKIVIVSGKGGVGKSMLSSSLSMLFAKEQDIVAVDCDADAPNLAIWLNETNWDEVRKLSVSEKPLIDNSKLNGKAEECANKCRFNALKVVNDKLELNSFLCEGCGACEIFCPSGAIEMKPVQSGEIRIKQTKYGFPLVSGYLYPGEAGSGKMVDEIKKEAGKMEAELMIIDSAPGTSCPVIASLQGADYALLVTEPTLSGLSDLKKVLNVIKHFNIPWMTVVNKYNINPKVGEEIKKLVGSNFLGKISYDKRIFKSISNLIPIMETELKAKKEIKEIYNKLKLWLDQ